MTTRYIARGQLLSPGIVDHSIGRLERSAFDVSKQSSEAMVVDEPVKCLVRRQVRTNLVAMARTVGKYGEDLALVGEADWR